MSPRFLGCFDWFLFILAGKMDLISADLAVIEGLKKYSTV